MTIIEALELTNTDPEVRALAQDLLRLAAGVSLSVPQIVRIVGQSDSTVRRRLRKINPVSIARGDKRYAAKDVRRIWGIE